MRAVMCGLVVVFAAFVMACGGGGSKTERATSESETQDLSPGNGTSAPKSDKTPPILLSRPARNVTLGEYVKCGDLNVAITFVGLAPFTSQGKNGEVVHKPELLVDLGIKCENQKAEPLAHSQVDRITVRDDAGNTYNQLATRDEFGGATKVRGQILPDKPQKVKFNSPIADRFVYPKPAPEASNLIIEIDLVAYGSHGLIRLTVGRESFAPKK